MSDILDAPISNKHLIEAMSVAYWMAGRAGSADPYSPSWTADGQFYRRGRTGTADKTIPIWEDLCNNEPKIADAIRKCAKEILLNQNYYTLLAAHPWFDPESARLAAVEIAKVFGAIK